MMIEIDGMQKQYQLKGVICHHGSAQRGHYTFCKKNEHSFTEYSDESLMNVSNPKNLYIAILEATGPIEDGAMVRPIKSI